MPSFVALVYKSFFFSEQPFHRNYLALDSHTNTVMSHTFACSSNVPTTLLNIYWVCQYKLFLISEGWKGFTEPSKPLLEYHCNNFAKHSVFFFLFLVLQSFEAFSQRIPFPDVLTLINNWIDLVTVVDTILTSRQTCGKQTNKLTKLALYSVLTPINICYGSRSTTNLRQGK